LIINNDNPAQLPTLSVANDSETEGDGSIFPSRLRFVVTLSTASSQSVTVQANTAAGFASKAVPTVSALAGAKNCYGADSDYIAKSTSVQFEPGQTTKTVDISICQDSRNELNENLRLVLSAATNATIADGEATGYILDDD
jgi:chitinase